MAAQLIKNACVSYSLQQMSLVLVVLVFTSRQDVDSVRVQLVAAFMSAEEGCGR